VKHVKDLDVVLGAEKAVVIMDDTAGVWPSHLQNLLQVHRNIPAPPPCAIFYPSNASPLTLFRAPLVLQICASKEGRWESLAVNVTTGVPCDRWSGTYFFRRARNVSSWMCSRCWSRAEMRMSSRACSPLHSASCSRQALRLVLTLPSWTWQAVKHLYKRTKTSWKDTETLAAFSCLK
jgi:hypothetical protein